MDLPLPHTVCITTPDTCKVAIGRKPLESTAILGKAKQIDVHGNKTVGVTNTSLPALTVTVEHTGFRDHNNDRTEFSIVCFRRQAHRRQRLRMLCCPSQYSIKEQPSP